MTTYRDTYDNLCVLLEDYADADIETIAEQILAMLGLEGEDVVETLDPPPGLQHWLVSHGLSLVPTVPATSPRVWEVAQGEDDDEEEEEGKSDTENQPLLFQVGDHVEYRTAPRGPANVSQIGAGRVMDIGEDAFWVRTDGGPDVYIVPEEGDFIRMVE